MIRFSVYYIDFVYFCINNSKIINLWTRSCTACSGGFKGGLGGTWRPPLSKPDNYIHLALSRCKSTENEHNYHEIN